jgi:hypothetical protein
MYANLYANLIPVDADFSLYSIHLTTLAMWTK